MAKTTQPKKAPVTPPESSSNRGFLFAVAGILVVGLAVVAFVATNRDTDSASDPDTPIDDAAQTGTVTLDGEPLPPMPEGVQITDSTTDPAAGTVAPTLSGANFDGTEVKIEADGSPKVVYFLAHWCPHCQAEVPLVQQLIDDGKQPEGLSLYAVSTAVASDQDNYPPQAWLDGEDLSVPIIADDANNSAMAGYGGAGFPYVVYLDGENRVIARSSGSLDGGTIEELWQTTAAG